jgi:hypothetical protein
MYLIFLACEIVHWLYIYVFMQMCQRDGRGLYVFWKLRYLCMKCKVYLCGINIYFFFLRTCVISWPIFLFHSCNIQDRWCNVFTSIVCGVYVIWMLAFSYLSDCQYVLKSVPIYDAVCVSRYHWTRTAQLKPLKPHLLQYSDIMKPRGKQLPLWLI